MQDLGRNAPAMITIQHILAPVDSTKEAAGAVRYAATLAQAHQARLYVLHIKAPFPVHGRIAAGSLEDVQEHQAKKEQAQRSDLIPARVRDSITVKEFRVTGMPITHVIVEKARELNVDVIVMPVYRRKGWMRFFKENVTQQVIQKAPCSVFVVRSPQDPSGTSSP
jgi:nucleotide-binding universal stress UspA family protein